ncbi:MAG: glycosyltransferase family 39 protein [Lentimicrobium sp.]|nr:glycosyltransferase family 39 protein [Lentimicrobium sp.]
MSKYLNRIKNNPNYLFGIIILMLPFVLFLNLGLMPLISDEPTRAIVTQEMIISGNYITPTINGEFYYNKPPMFNWILAGFIQLSGRQNEFIHRLPTVISLILMGVILYFFSRKSLGRNYGIITALMWITSARILFWDSFQGLIDITYALVTFASFVALFQYSQHKKWLLMFVITWGLTAVGYLMKGLPSLAFQGFSMLVWLAYEKNLRKLFSWQHLAGISVFLLFIGVYYYNYLQTNSLQDVFATLLDQSNRIKDKDGTFLSWVSHLFVFPFEMIYEFAPWTLLLLLLFVKKIRDLIFRDKLIIFSMLIFLANIFIYWVSADIRPRYLFMLFPLLFIILAKAYQSSQDIKSGISNFLNIAFSVLAFAGTFSLLVYLFWNETKQATGVWIIIPFLFIISLVAAILSIKQKKHNLLFLIIVLLAVRIGFNTFNLPARYNSYPDADYREGEIITGRIIKGNEAYILGNTPFNHDASFYISRESGQIIKRTWEISENETYYITDEQNLSNFAINPGTYQLVHNFSIKLYETQLYLIKMPL